MKSPRIAISTLVLSLTVTAGQLFAQCAPSEYLPASFEGVVRPALAVDVNPDPDVLEVYLNAEETLWDYGVGPATPSYSYNGVIPGPTLQAKLGDLLIVHFCNALPEESTIHWHGVETPANMDGSHISQIPVPSGGSFTYEIPLINSGVFWYHPHVRTHRQVEQGLHGVLIVKDEELEAGLDLPSREHIFVLDDITLDEFGEVKEHFQGTREEVALEQLNGREGDLPLLNGVSVPQLRLEKRVPHRIRMLNVANSRFLRMSVPEHDFWRIGGGQGLLTEAIGVEPVGPDDPFRHPTIKNPTTGLLMTPGERVDVLIFPVPNEEESPLLFEWHDWQRGRHSVEFKDDGSVEIAHNVPDGSIPPIEWATIELYGSSEARSWTPPQSLTEITPIDYAGAPTLRLVLGHTIPDYDTGEVVFFIQDMGKPWKVLTPEDVHTVMSGETYIWEVLNLTGGHHNFHTHGFSFQHIETLFLDMDNVLNNSIEPAKVLENRDTILIERRAGAVRGRSSSLTRLAVTFNDDGREGQVAAGGKAPTASRSGGWLLHCHILEHAALGMMSFFQVEDVLFEDGFEDGSTEAWTTEER